MLNKRTQRIVFASGILFILALAAFGSLIAVAWMSMNNTIAVAPDGLYTEETKEISQCQDTGPVSMADRSHFENAVDRRAIVSMVDRLHFENAVDRRVIVSMADRLHFENAVDRRVIVSMVDRLYFENVIDSRVIVSMVDYYY
ncbi:MAG: hypothetical protein ACFFCP_06430 [Promethearchaeota archaeon]